jgi:type II secretory pathway pseudopilin PulG
MPSGHGRSALTLVETLIVGALLAVVLLACALLVKSVRTELKYRQSVELLSRLNEALEAYRAAVGAWPDVSDSPDDRTAAARVLEQLAAVDASRIHLQRIDPILRIPGTQPHDIGGVRDGWGHPLRCLTTASTAPADRQAVVANGGRPIFISAGDLSGFDGDAAEEAETIRSDELWH